MAGLRAAAWTIATPAGQQGNTLKGCLASDIASVPVMSLGLLWGDHGRNSCCILLVIYAHEVMKCVARRFDVPVLWTDGAQGCWTAAVQD